MNDNSTYIHLSTHLFLLVFVDLAVTGKDNRIASAEECLNVNCHANANASNIWIRFNAIR